MAAMALIEPADVPMAQERPASLAFAADASPCVFPGSSDLDVFPVAPRPCRMATRSQAVQPADGILDNRLFDDGLRSSDRDRTFPPTANGG